MDSGEGEGVCGCEVWRPGGGGREEVVREYVARGGERGTGVWRGGLDVRTVGQGELGWDFDILVVHHYDVTNNMWKIPIHFNAFIVSLKDNEEYT